jgi:hypothetical protein
VYGSHLTIVPGDRNRIPTRFSDSAAISGIASPINTVTLLEAFLPTGSPGRLSDTQRGDNMKFVSAAAYYRFSVPEINGIFDKEATINA